MVELGDKVRDKVTGLTGIAVSRHSYLNGCDRIGVQQPVDKDGKLPDAPCFDEPQLEVLDAGVAAPDPVESSKRTGGPDKYPDRAKPAPSR